jgi:hypothetical protein
MDFARVRSICGLIPISVLMICKFINKKIQRDVTVISKTGVEPAFTNYVFPEYFLKTQGLPMDTWQPAR